MRSHMACPIGVLGLLTSSLAAAGPIYDFSFTFPAETITGTLQTDGTIGILKISNISAVSVLASGDVNITVSLTLPVPIGAGGAECPTTDCGWKTLSSGDLEFQFGLTSQFSMNNTANVAAFELNGANPAGQQVRVRRSVPMGLAEIFEGGYPAGAAVKVGRLR